MTFPNSHALFTNSPALLLALSVTTNPELRHGDDEATLCFLLEQWSAGWLLECRSADEMLADATDPDQRDWLQEFCMIWDDVMSGLEQWDDGRCTFMWRGVAICDPFLPENTIGSVTPEYYGFRKTDEGYERNFKMPKEDGKEVLYFCRKTDDGRTRCSVSHAETGAFMTWVEGSDESLIEQDGHGWLAPKN